MEVFVARWTPDAYADCDAVYSSMIKADIGVHKEAKRLNLDLKVDNQGPNWIYFVSGPADVSIQCYEVDA